MAFSDQWIQARIGRAIASEPLATCDSCAMCSGRQHRKAVHFRPDVKCCTYWPKLPNYEVGAILVDDTPQGAEGSARVQAMCKQGWALPTVLADSPAHRILYAAGNRLEFGRSLLLRCPYYETSTEQCTIWRHRNAVCRTWFCRYERGAVGHNAWATVRRFLDCIEKSVSVWAATELGISYKGIRLAQQCVDGDGLSIVALDGILRPEYEATVWGDWRGAKDQFYKRCHELVTTLSWDDVSAIGGNELRARGTEMEEAVAATDASRVPDFVTAGPMKVLEATPDSCAILTYNELAPEVLPRAVFDVLVQCKGWSVAKLRALVAESAQLEVTDSMISHWCDVKLLEASDNPELVVL